MFASSQENQINSAVKGDTHNAFILTYILVYEYNFIASLEIEELRKIRQTIKEAIRGFLKEKSEEKKKEIEEKKEHKQEKDITQEDFAIAAYPDDMDIENYPEFTKIYPEIYKVLKIFDDYIEIREHKKDEKSFCQKATDILSWICSKILTFFSSYFPPMPPETFLTNEAVTLHDQHKNREPSPHLFSLSTSDYSRKSSHVAPRVDTAKKQPLSTLQIKKV